MTTLEELIQNVQAWGVAKGITGPNGKATLLGQLEKTQEELTETRDAAVICQYASEKQDPDAWLAAQEKLQDGFGDQVVTLILGMQLAGLTMEGCLGAAYREIKDRTGVMKDGVFVKDK